MALKGENKSPLPGATRMGWHLVCHPAFRGPLLALANAVARLREQGGTAWQDAPKAKLLKRILDLILREIPAGPDSAQYEQGNTLGADARGWRRAKFLDRFRLFFRFDKRAKVIVYAWVNDENTLRKEGALTDPYLVFRRMLLAGDPPHNWSKLLDACRGQIEEQGALGAVIGQVAAVPEPDPGPARRSSNRKRRG